jgi:hypothetical protein
VQFPGIMGAAKLVMTLQPLGGGLGTQDAEVRFPAKQEDCPLTVNPPLQVGWHVEPDARAALQFPLSPFAGLADASQDLGLHVAAVNVPVVQLAVPDTV